MRPHTYPNITVPAPHTITPATYINLAPIRVSCNEIKTSPQKLSYIVTYTLILYDVERVKNLYCWQSTLNTLLLCVDGMYCQLKRHVRWIFWKISTLLLFLNYCRSVFHPHVFDRNNLYWLCRICVRCFSPLLRNRVESILAAVVVLVEHSEEQ